MIYLRSIAICLLIWSYIGRNMVVRPRVARLQEKSPKRSSGLITDLTFSLLQKCCVRLSTFLQVGVLFMIIPSCQSYFYFNMFSVLLKNVLKNSTLNTNITRTCYAKWLSICS